eukprot:TRINITY_DN2086_c0_g1_i2.p1 TRINITY_DN2086_c0_g1~~TRINITY_DN2086_c0_g1_i2.p1  ORF type:complete len:764 (+),score=291.62 TRINITY_DN2086_c0_g1_i2:300-2294(+)
MNSYIVLDGPAREGESDIRRSWVKTDGFNDASKSEAKTLYETFFRTVAKFPQQPCLGRRSVKADGTAGPYVFQNYKQVAARVNDVGSGLASLGLNPGDKTGLYAINRPEWIIAEYGSFCHGLCTVPLYDTLGPDAAEYVIRQAECVTVFCSRDKVSSLVAMAPRCPKLRHVVVMPPQPWDKPSQDKIDFSTPLQILSFDELERKGKENPQPHRPPRPTDFATFCYTSGTTGDPKGAMLTHSNVVSNAQSVLQVPGAVYSENDVHVSFLPLAHMFERTCISLLLSVGASVGFFRGDVLLLLDDVATLKPTIFVGVPRLFNRIHDKIMSQAKEAGGLRSWLFEQALASKLDNLAQNGDLTHWFWDRLVFGKVKAALGGRVRLILTGSAPISASVLNFLRVAFAAQVVEGYGQTEANAAVSVTDVEDPNAAGHVGNPLPCCEIKLVDVPEMKYTGKDVINGVPCPRGEICVRGSNVFSGYFKMEDKTNEALVGGWLHSGDIGMWTPQGNLKIIDRKKNIFKLAQGEYIAPEKIENVYVKNPFVAQIFVYGDSLQSELVAVVVPDPETLGPWCKKNNIPGTIQDWVKNKKVEQMIFAEMNATGKEGQLRGFEFVKAIHLDAEPFAVENNLLTPTMKLKRNEAKEKYLKQIESMYAVLNAAAAKVKSNL